MATPNLIIDSFISFQSKSAPGDYFNGTVYFFEPENGRFGIEDVMRQNIGGDLKVVEGNYQFSLKDIKVIALPCPQQELTTNTKKGDRKRKLGSDASSLASAPSSA